MADESARRRANWVVRFYTRARRVPTLIGKLPDGSKIPFGPFTTLQLIAAVGTLIVAFKTRDLWGFGGGLMDLLVVVCLAVGVGKLVGRFETGFHNPVVIAAGAVNSIFLPRFGSSGGRPVRLPRTVRLGGRISVQSRVMSVDLATEPDVSQAAAYGEVPEPRAARFAVMEQPARGDVARPEPMAVSTPPPLVGAESGSRGSAFGDENAAGRLTGVQALLAQSGAGRS